MEFALITQDQWCRKQSKLKKTYWKKMIIIIIIIIVYAFSFFLSIPVNLYVFFLLLHNAKSWKKISKWERRYYVKQMGRGPKWANIKKMRLLTGIYFTVASSHQKKSKDVEWNQIDDENITTPSWYLEKNKNDFM